MIYRHVELRDISVRLHSVFIGSIFVSDFNLVCEDTVILTKDELFDLNPECYDFIVDEIRTRVYHALYQ